MIDTVRKSFLPACLALLVAGCATPPTTDQPALADQAPWWETNGPCRVFLPGERIPADQPVHVGATANSRLSGSGDCRELQASMPDDAVLLGTP